MKIISSVLILFLITSCENYDSPGFIFQFDPVNQRFEQSLEYNKLHPPVNLACTASEYTLFVMGDTHVGETYMLDYFQEEALSNNAIATIMAGDLTTGKEADYELFENHLLHKTILPSFLVAGNHDLFFQGWEQYLSRFGSSTYYFTVDTPGGSDLFICLDTGSGTLGDEQLEWFKNLLSDLRDDFRWCIIVTHNNIFRIRKTFSTNPLVEEIAMYMDLFLSYNVDMVITGHDHIKNVVELGNTTHITLDALKYGINKPGYMELHVSGTQIEYDFINID